MKSGAALSSRGSTGVAVLIGSWFKVSLDCANLRANLLQPLKADLHLQLTYRPDVDNCNSTSTCRIVERFSQLGPITGLYLDRQRTTMELLAMLQASPHWPRLLKWYVDAGGCKEVKGPKLYYHCPKIPEKGNSFMAPVFGSPRLNVLRQIYLQSLVFQRLQEHEAQRGSQYETIVWSRLELQWLAPHTPLHVISFQTCSVWTPIGEDYAGLNDRHAIFIREIAPIYLGRWDAILKGRLFDIYQHHMHRHAIGHQSSERYMAMTLAHYNLSHCYLPTFAYLMCCATVGHCYKTACLHMRVAPALGLTDKTVGLSALNASGKYLKEMASALLHAAALQHPDAQLRLVPRTFKYAGAAHSKVFQGPSHLDVSLPAHVFTKLQTRPDVRKVRHVLGPISFNYTLLSSRPGGMGTWGGVSNL